MKKLLILFLFAGLVFSTTSCKKKECPKPEVWGVGTWKATKYVENGAEQSSSDPEVACILTNQLNLNDSWEGSWEYHYYDSNNSSCETIHLTLDSWLENIDKKILVVNFTYNQIEFSFPFKYTDDSHFRLENDAQNYLEFTKQD